MGNVSFALTDFYNTVYITYPVQGSVPVLGHVRVQDPSYFLTNPKQEVEVV